MNTFGAAIGAFGAGFYLPAALGFRYTYLCAMGTNLLVGTTACLMNGRSRREAPAEAALTPPAATAGRGRARGEGDIGERRRGKVLALAVASGFLTLGVEVAAARLFAQVLQNSVYTFSATLVVFLTTLAAGAFVANRLSRQHWSPQTVLPALLLLSGLGVALVPFLYIHLTEHLWYAGSAGWTSYLVRVFASVVLVLTGPCTVIGAVFPFLLRVEEDSRASIGRTLGRLSAWNTVGAIAGSALTGFLLLPMLGLWGTFRTIAIGYFAAGLMLIQPNSPQRWRRLTPVIAVSLLFTALNPSHLAIVRVDTAGGEKLLDVRQGPYGVTAVVERDRHRLIKVNNRYSLGGTAGMEQQRNQALIPLVIHPRPQSVFFLGMGTGITAGAALQPDVRRVVVAELIPDVVSLARTHFTKAANGLFSDPRVEIHVTDGRNHLAGTRETYDMIIADLFIPWEAGAGSLYTREHFETVRAHLSPGAMFAQWLPLYQMSQREFFLIARTMLAVFQDVVIWRGDFFANRPIVALVAASPLQALDPAVVAARLRATRQAAKAQVEPLSALMFPYYMGNLRAAQHLIPAGSINSDDRPFLEYLAPITQREQQGGTAQWLNARELLTFSSRLLEAIPPERDPYLTHLDGTARGLVRAGFHYYAASVYRERGDAGRAAEHFRQFHARLTPELRRIYEVDETRWGVERNAR